MRFAYPTLASLLVLTAACATDGAVGLAPNQESALTVDGGPTTTVATVRVRCEVRGTRRSKISVDVNNLSPLNARWSSRVTSGSNVATSPASAATADEVEFDYDSDPANILAGATPIARTFITVNSTGPDVNAVVMNAAGAVVASGAADCRVR